MKKGNNNNTLHPHLLEFWIKGHFKEGVILRTKKNINKEEKQKTQSKEKDDDEDIWLMNILWHSLIKTIKAIWGKN